MAARALPKTKRPQLQVWIDNLEEVVVSVIVNSCEHLALRRGARDGRTRTSSSLGSAHDGHHF
jgi:hypothetical protein